MMNLIAAPGTTHWITTTPAIGHLKFFAMFGDLPGAKVHGVRFVLVLAADESAHQLKCVAQWQARLGEA